MLSLVITPAFALSLCSSLVAQAVLITSPVTIGPTDKTITATLGGVPVPLATAQIVVDGATLTVNGRHSVASLRLTNGAQATHGIGFTYDYSGRGLDIVHGLDLSMTGGLVVEAGCAIDVSSAGYARGVGPGSGYANQGCSFPGGITSSGGGHGGLGGNVCGEFYGKTYGDFASPCLFGSAGGSGDTVPPRGGGAAVLRCVGVAVIDGEILSKGGSRPVTGGSGSSLGGGSGGSLWLEAKSISGSGTISVIGGDATAGQWVRAGGGGGGRIRVDSDSLIPTSIQTNAWGGQPMNAASSSIGGAGSVYKVEAGVSTLLFDNNGFSGAESEAVATIEVDNILIRNGAILSVPRLERLLVVAAIDFTIEATGSISVTGKGHGPNRGFGSGFFRKCGLPGAASGTGGSHGGLGGKTGCLSGGGSVGNAIQPNMFGSGGGAPSAAISSADYSRGGGVVQLEVHGVLTVDGQITADGIIGGTGGSGQAFGGGSGGSVIIAANKLAGTGLVRAVGGAGGSARYAAGGSGSGGRIAHYFNVAGIAFPSIDARNGSVVSGSKVSLGHVENFAKGCATVGDKYFFLTELQQLGGTSIFSAKSKGASSPATLLIGFQTTSYFGQSLPFELAPWGMSGCSLSHDISIQIATVANASGESSWVVTLPATQALRGFVFYTTAFVWDYAQMTALGFLLTDTHKVTIGG